MGSPRKDEEDKALVRRAVGGDVSAFTALMRSYKSPLYSFAYRHVGDGDDAEDIVQDTFIAMHRNLARFNPKYKFSTWAFQIAMNKCRDLGRRRKTRAFMQRISPFMETRITKMGSEENPEHAIDTKRQLDTIGSEITKLPKNLKAPFILCVLEEMSQKQAAEILAISPKAVETRIYRARAILAKTLKVED